MLVDASGRLIAVNDRGATGKPLETKVLHERNYKQAGWFRACMAGEYSTKMEFSDSANTIANGTVITRATADADVQQAYGPAAAGVIGFSAPLRSRTGEAIGCWRNLATAELVTTVLADAARDLGSAGYRGATLLVVSSSRTPRDTLPVARPMSRSRCAPGTMN